MLELTPSQARFARLARVGGHGALACHIGIELDLQGTLDVERLAAAWQTLQRSHVAFALRFDGGFTRQWVDESVPPQDLEIFELPPATSDSERHALVRELVERPFTLDGKPGARACLLREGTQSARLVLVFHHLVCDGYGAAVAVSEVARIYGGKASRGAVAADTFLSHVGVLNAQGGRTLPVPAPGPDVFIGERRSVIVPKATVVQLRRLGGRQGATLFMTLFAAWQKTFGELSGKSRFTVAVPLAARGLPGAEKVVGNYVTLAPYDVSLTGGESFDDLVRQVKGAMPDLWAIADSPLRASRLNQEAAFSSTFNLEPAGPLPQLPEVKVELASVLAPGVEFPLMFNLTEETSGDLRLEMDFQVCHHHGARVEAWLEAYARYLRTLVDPGT